MHDVPVILFAYARPVLLERVLTSLRENTVERIVAFADAPASEGIAAATAEVRRKLHAIDWADVRLVERPTNFGLGRNVIAGVTEVAAQEESFIVWEDDLLAAPGTYRWLCDALEVYRDDGRVMSVTGWTHPAVTPPDVDSAPYLDGRAECWVWGAWRRSWAGMPDETALEKMRAAERQGIDRRAYGADLPQMAANERRRNLWAVRWLYHHLQHGGLCCRPPWNRVEHIGVGRDASNVRESGPAEAAIVRPDLPRPQWPDPIENPACRSLWRSFAAPTPWWRRVHRRLRGLLPSA
jgi:hypothetical protein